MLLGGLFGSCNLEGVFDLRPDFCADPAFTRRADRAHQLHNVCRTRIKMPIFCLTCDRIVDRNEIEKG
jgi:hypothetical protein